MRVTQEADYAIRMCLILDKLGEKTGAATLADIACITPKIALKVLRKLNVKRAGTAWSLTALKTFTVC